MAASLILHKRIKTTTAKAKALRVFIEPILTKSKEDSTHARRLAFTYLQDKDAVTTLFREVSPKISERPGGYTRILKIGTRVGDAAEMCYIELVDFNEAMLATAGAGEAKTTRRSRRGSKKKTEEEGTLKSAKTAATAEVKAKKVKAKTPVKSSPSKKTTGKTEPAPDADNKE
jgi:large subunit ribosomal protein L17